MEAASEPLLGSVRQNAAVHSPVAKRGKYFSFCSSLPAINKPWKNTTNKQTNRWNETSSVDTFPFPTSSPPPHLQTDGLVSGEDDRDGAVEGRDLADARELGGVEAQAAVLGRDLLAEQAQILQALHSPPPQKKNRKIKPYLTRYRFMEDIVGTKVNREFLD